MAPTSLMLLEPGYSLVIACILGSTSVAPARQKRERGCFERINASVHRRRTSAAAAAAALAEQSPSSHRDRCEEQITRAAANMLGQPRQSVLHITYKREPAYCTTLRCVSLILGACVTVFGCIASCDLWFLRSSSGSSAMRLHGKSVRICIENFVTPNAAGSFSSCRS